MLLSRVPSKLDKGDKLRAFYQLKLLSEEFDVYLICLDTEASWYDLSQIEPFVKGIKIFRITRWSKLVNLFLAMFNGKPYQVAYFYNSRVKKEIQQIIQNFQPDHIYAQLIRTAEYVKDIHNIPKTLDYMDAFSKGIERRIPHVNFFLKPLFRSENKRLLKYESLIFEYFENKTIISEIDRDFIFHIDRSKITVVSNGIDKCFYDSRSKWENEPKVLFTGNMSYPPNIKACDFILNDLAPKMNQYNFVIAGANSDLIHNRENLKNVNLTGWVEDIKLVYKEAKVFVAPMFIGTGVQNKLLEAMAMGLPCITSDLGNKPLKAEVEKEILIANTPEEFQSQIKRLLEDKQLYNRIAEGGRDFVSKNFNWEESTQKLIGLMNK